MLAIFFFHILLKFALVCGRMKKIISEEKNEKKSQSKFSILPLVISYFRGPKARTENFKWDFFFFIFTNTTSNLRKIKKKNTIRALIYYYYNIRQLTKKRKYLNYYFKKLINPI